MTKKYCSLFILLTTFHLHAQNCITNPPDFIYLSYNEANATVKSEDDSIGRGAEKVCPEYITNLVYQLREGHLSNDNKTLAIYLLGELHPNDTNSIEFLIENIDFKATKIDPPWAPRRWGEYPAEEALITVGQPAVIPILNHLPSETNQLRRQLMCDVLKQVLRREKQ